MELLVILLINFVWIVRNDVKFGKYTLIFGENSVLDGKDAIFGFKGLSSNYGFRLPLPWGHQLRAITTMAFLVKTGAPGRGCYSNLLGAPIKSHHHDGFFG
jgi:hypothetical protein